MNPTQPNPKSPDHISPPCTPPHPIPPSLLFTTNKPSHKERQTGMRKDYDMQQSPQMPPSKHVCRRAVYRYPSGQSMHPRIHSARAKKKKRYFDIPRNHLLSPPPNTTQRGTQHSTQQAQQHTEGTHGYRHVYHTPVQKKGHEKSKGNNMIGVIARS